MRAWVAARVRRWRLARQLHRLSPQDRATVLRVVQLMREQDRGQQWPVEVLYKEEKF